MHPTAAPTMTPVAAFKRAGLRESTVLLALAWFVPFAIHLVPWPAARPLGAYLLPVFWTTLVAVYFYGELAGFFVGIFSPLVNFAVTGQPSGLYAWQTAAELAVFVLLVAWAVRRRPKFFGAAPLAYALAKTLAAVLLTPQVLGSADGAGKFFVHLPTGSWPGLLALGAIAFALGRFYPKTLPSES